MKKIALIFLLLIAQASFAAPKVTLTGKVPSGYSEAAFYSQKGYYTRGKVSRKNFSVIVAAKDLKGGSLILNKSGNKFGGAVVLAQKGAKSFLQFTSTTAKTISLGAVLKNAKGFLKLQKALATKYYNTKSNAVTSLLGAPLGLNIGASSSNARALHTLANTGDLDRDGVPDGVDVDVDGDGSIDTLTSGASSDIQAPYLVIRENMSHTINQTATGIPSADAIDEILTSSGSSEFVIGFGFSVRDDLTRITGAHVVCSDTDPLCGRTSGLATVNSGSNGLWRDYHPDGTSYPGLDVSTGGGGEKFFNTAIKPHVGPSAILPGSTYRVEFTGAGGSVIRSKLATVSPYLVTVPALHSYTANSTDHTVDYNNISTEPGASMSNPIVLGNDGLLTITYWRPQRQSLGGADGEGYVDVGHLRYGIMLLGQVGGGGGGGPGQQGCAGYYSSLSSTLTEDGASPSAMDFWSLNDSASDGTSDVGNTITFTVDVKSCLTRAGYTAGDYMLSIQAAGADLGHGANSSGQDFIVRVP